ncbi:PadR family transcriptional regulator [Nocardiopsis sp. CNT312]|uniref:PadR family transcriptional regulator n=1 Tax=Nocardiopsis sp. CNT312 TaxID=1137268 RepID=UPI00048D4D51|nr:PadR family transcriptional regulator [Nocardiopsis sp. CNT312]
MSSMALPGPWAWDERGGRGRGSRGPSTEDTPRGGRGRPRRGDRLRAEEGPRGRRRGGPGRPPMLPVPPGAPWGEGGFGGPFAGFGPPGGRRGGRRGGPRARRGDVRTGILMLLAEEPRSGYEIIREGRERSGGLWRPSPGSVYPMLQQLEDEGLVAQAEGEGRRRPYRLTEEGLAHLDERGADLTPPWEAGEDAYADTRSRYEELGAVAHQLSAAAAQVVQAGSDAQVERAKRLLNETRRGLYRILAEDDGTAESDDS